MTTAFRPYGPARDFLRVRDFLKQHYYDFGRPRNWGLERWNWARYHPSVFCERDPGVAESRIAFWEGAVGLWEDSGGGILGLVCPEQPRPAGEAFLQRAAGADHLLPEMLDYAERSLAEPATGTLRVDAYEDDEALAGLLADRGYRPRPGSRGCAAERPIGELPPLALPAGFEILSMAEGFDAGRRCEAQGLGFDHADPAEWMTVAEYAEVRKAPDYRPELDLAIRAPDGEYASCGILWHDDRNRIAFLEPLCTVPAYRRLGLARELVLEGLRRVASMGATRCYVGSTQEFYRRIGFRMENFSRTWERSAGRA